VESKRFITDARLRTFVSLLDDFGLWFNIVTP
jgi:alkyl sulfatase BDS1-like metallo-beta-lactamase superfamily hydrolase